MASAGSTLVRAVLLTWFVAVGSWSPCRAALAVVKGPAAQSCCHTKPAGPRSPQRRPADCVHCGTADRLVSTAAHAGAVPTPDFGTPLFVRLADPALAVDGAVRLTLVSASPSPAEPDSALHVRLL